MEILYVIIEFFVKVAIATVCLWLAVKLTKEEGPFIGLLGACFIAGLVEMIPYWLVPVIYYPDNFDFTVDDR